MEKTERETSVEVVDREEGEIIDVETYNNDLLELESISSDEEENLRERIRELEAKNAELAKLAMVAKEERRTFNYGDDVWSISSEEEYYQHQPKMSKFDTKINHRKDIRGRPMKRFNNRYRSPPKFRPLSPSPEFKRRRRSTSPVRRERIRQTGWFNNKKDQKRYSTKRKRRRNRSDSESVDGKLIKAQLNHALQRSSYQPRKNHNSLMKKLRLEPEVANNKENENIIPNGIKEEASSDEELIALRLNALKSKREVKEIIQENQVENLTSSIQAVQNGHNKNDDYDTEEMELRLLALKSAIVKKAENRKKHRQTEAYSPTDGLTTILPPEQPDSEMMDISPISSPILDDAILQPIDMDIATPEDSNSPAFFVSFDDASNNHILPIQPVATTAQFNPVLIPIIPKVTSNGIPIGIINRSVLDEFREKRASTRSPSNLIQLTGNKKDRRSKSLDGLNNEQKIDEKDDDDDEEALRSLLLAKLNSTTPKTKGLEKEKSCPIIMESDTVSSNITSDITNNLKKAAKRIKDLSDQESQLINFELDRIIWKPATPEPRLSKETNEESQKSETSISLKEVAERLKNAKEAKDKLNKASIVQETPFNVSVVTADVSKIESDMQENIPKPEIIETEICMEEKIETESCQNLEKSTVKIATSNQILNPSDDKNVTEEPNLLTKSIKSDDLINQMEPKKIVNAMSAIAQSLQPKPQPSVVKPKLAPIIMKRKKKTKSSIINVPFQKQAFTIKKLPKTNPAIASSSSSLPLTSSLITSLESVIKPVHKVVIQLGQSSTEDDSSDDDDDEEEDDDELNMLSRSTIASPSHITELGDIMIDSPKSITINNSEQNEGVSKVDSTFELRLDQFLKQARAKTEQEQEIMQKKSGEKAVKGVSVQGTSSAVKYLNPSAQIEYKKLQLKIMMLEKQKQARLQSNGNIQITVKNDAFVEENITPPRTISGTTVTTTICEKPKVLSFEEKVLKLSEEQKERLLQKAETNLTDYSTKFLNELSDYIVTIEEATIEKKQQLEMEKEVNELKAKLAVLESKLTNQKTKLTKIYPMVSNKHKKLLQSRDKYLKLSRSCTKIGQSVKEDYQFKTDAQKQIFEKLKTLPSKAKQLKHCGDPIEPHIETIVNQEDIQNPTNNYKSVLDCINSNEGTTTDGVVCPFQLAGKCSDPECKYIHLP